MQVMPIIIGNCEKTILFTQETIYDPLLFIYIERNPSYTVKILFFPAQTRLCCRFSADFRLKMFS